MIGTIVRPPPPQLSPIPMVYSLLLKLINCDVPHVEPSSKIGSSCQTRKSQDFTHPNVLSKHVASDLQLRHVYHVSITEKSMKLLEKEVHDGNKEHVDLGGPADPLDQAEIGRECALLRWIVYSEGSGIFRQANDANTVVPSSSSHVPLSKNENSCGCMRVKVDLE